MTGASAGIGEAICRDLCANNVIVAGLARREDRLIKLGEDILKKTPSARFFPVVCDLAQEDQIKAAFEKVIAQFGGVDILINNAGIVTKFALLEEGSDDMLTKVIQTNLLALLSCTKKAFKSMCDRDTDGYIVNVSSVAGHIVPNMNGLKPFGGTYSPSKFALTAVNKLLGQELVYFQRPKIRISSISPGLVKTEIFDGLGSSGFEELNHLKPEDISSSIMYILSTPSHVQVRELIVEPVGVAYY